MREDLDIYLGVGAWVVALVGQGLSHLLEPADYAWWGLYVQPALWVSCVYLMIRLRQRPARSLGWAWMSAPIGLYPLWFVLLYLPGS